jgi:hypothetical protein
VTPDDHYADVEDGICVNVVVCDDPDYAADQGWVPLAGEDPQPGIGWAYDGQTWTPPDPVPAPPPDPGYPAWVQPEGAHDAYHDGDRVAHNTANWISRIDANVWEPGEQGWAELAPAEPPPPPSRRRRQG